MTKLNDLLTLDLQFFAEPGEPEQTPEEPTPALEKSFTQAELDEIVEKRLARDRTKYADYDDLKTKAAEFEAERKRIEDEKLSESERLQKALDEAHSSKQEIEEQLTAMQKQAEQQLIKTAFVRKASEAGIKYTDAAVKLSDMGALQFDESGELIGVDDAINALITENPFLVEVEALKPKIIGGGSDAGGEHVEKSKEKMLEEAADKAKKSGRIEDRIAFDKLKRQLG